MLSTVALGLCRAYRFGGGSLVCISRDSGYGANSEIAAMTALKRKKMHMNHLTSTQSQIATLEQQMHAVETANLNVETLKVMKSASNAMKVIHGGMNVDKVDETMYVKQLFLYSGNLALAESMGLVWFLLTAMTSFVFFFSTLRSRLLI